MIFSFTRSPSSKAAEKTSYTSMTSSPKKSAREPMESSIKPGKKAEKVTGEPSKKSPSVRSNNQSCFSMRSRC